MENIPLSSTTKKSPTGPTSMATSRALPASNNMLSESDKVLTTPMNQVLLSVKLHPQNAATTLATRTTENVIADLKRPIHPAHAIANTHWPAADTLNDEEPERITQWVKQTDPLSEFQDEGNYQIESQEDYLEPEEEDKAHVAKPRKISERKRRNAAIADRYIQSMLRRDLEDGISRVKPGEESQQSARWLVNQSESHRIISSPRAYQTELFDLAKEKNVIAVLDTGSGKTLIAVLLLRHVFAQELEDRARGKAKKVSFFLVDSVTLVFQQHAVLKANLDQPMNMFCGDMGTDLWNPEIWAKHLNENMVIVCTAEVLRHCLAHAFITIEQINLLIFDEAHHAKKDHPYSRIIMDHYARQPKHLVLPKIFGMTASPVDSKTDVKKAATDLETILHSQIVTAADGSLGGYKVTSKQEMVAAYQSLGPVFKTPLYEQMYSRFKDNKSIFRKPLKFASLATRELGSWCADQVWPFCLSEDESKKLLAKTEKHYHSKNIPEPLSVLEQRKAQLVEAKQILASHRFEVPDYTEGSLNSSNLSSKVVLLVQYLRERFERPTDDKAIIFVKQRYTARLLAQLFKLENIRTEHIQVGTLVGTRTGVAGDLNVSFRDQVITMMNFRSGKLNCLFATSVAEEGLDIPDCNLIIRFDLYDNLIQYIQSRGRARQANSRFIHMYENGNSDHMSMIKQVRINEDILERFCRALPEDRKLVGNEGNIDHFLAKERSHQVYTVPETGARLTYKMSLMVLATFVDSLAQGVDSTACAEYIIAVQNKEYICEVILPEKSPIRGALGRPHTTKAVAKCSAAFNACVALRQGKYLDQNLRPTFTKQLPAMRNALLAVDSKKREAFDMRTKPNMWSVDVIPEEVYVTIFSLDKPECLDRPSQPLAILTRKDLPQLPSFPLHFGAGKYSVVQITTLARPFKIDAARLELANAFTLLIFNDVFSKEYESDMAKMPYFIVPVEPGEKPDQNSDPGNVIAWETLIEVMKRQQDWGNQRWENKIWKNQPDSFFEDKFLVDPYDGSRKLWTVGVDHGKTPLEPVPPGSAPRKGNRRNNDNILEYSCSLWAAARSRRSFNEVQPVVKAKLIPLRRNLLDEFDIQKSECDQSYVIIEPLRVSPLPTAIVAMAYTFPAVIHRLESYLIALDGCAVLKLDIKPDLALEAFTKDFEDFEEHGQEQVTFQRGMGRNYERLEFYGDAFLKMATSISLYGTLPENNEYAYHVDRMLLICNKNLRNNSVDLKLYEYIRSKGFSRRAWYPAGIVLKKGKKTTDSGLHSHRLGDKTIADVSEAIIGAALLSTNTMDNAVRAVTELVASKNHEARSYSDYYKLYKKPVYQTAPATEAHKWLAQEVEKKHSYHFNYPRLLRSAFLHPSYPFAYEKIPSYQRLEFLGDALYDMVCIDFLFHSFPDKDPQWLTEHKMAMVSNQFLGALCVHLNFQTHILNFNSTYQAQITNYVTDIKEARRQAEEEAVRAGKLITDCLPDYWTSIKQPPKCLPDMVEAFIGALFVDSEYDYSQVQRFFDEHVKWYFRDMSVYDSFANKHPTTFLTKFLQVQMGCMDWNMHCQEKKSIDGSKPEVVCVVMIHSKVVSDHTAESTRYAKVNAAKKAVELLKGLPLPEFREKYNCDCREDIEATKAGARHVY